MKILLAGLGGGCGIGRYEVLLLSALENSVAGDGVELSSLWRNRHASYLNVPARHAKRDGRATRRPHFALKVIWHAVAMPADIVIFTLPNLAPLALPLSLLRPSTRVVVCTHGIEIWSRLSWARGVALRRAHRVVASATYNAERIAAVQRVRPERIEVIPLALSPSWGAGGRDADVSARRQDGTKLLSVARMEASEGYKGVDAVICALPHVRRRVPEVSYTVVGVGTDLERLRRLAKDCGVADAVRFVGTVDDVRLLREYQECDVFVLPSTGEGFGLVFLEAMSFGKPIVAAAAGGAIDIVQDGETGRLVESPDEVADAVLELLLNRDAAKEMGARGRARLEAVFSFDRYVERWREALHVVLAERT
jgi:glycosyltransferase involved in cell wall biosynthesis